MDLSNALGTCDTPRATNAGHNVSASRTAYLRRWGLTCEIANV